ncbi:hypothetical protein ACYEXS_32565 [Paenibacillus sp. MAH-36]|uniref:Uncharacterized protein n=1 Tax=Paenibacillus violae TaxID=3077234 RepID=A0ABU3RQB8_9BACL|nr:hypothetical protein [Paenibacillus sp. PFR10]MDU0206362.1 hypothetical protein [Paenibacillus sp. PFR10]
MNDKRQIDKIEMVFDKTTEQHLLSLAPSAERQAEGAFPFGVKVPKLSHKLTIVI